MYGNRIPGMTEQGAPAETRRWTPRRLFLASMATTIVVGSVVELATGAPLVAVAATDVMLAGATALTGIALKQDNE